MPYVKPEERYLVGRVGPKEFRLYRVVARYGYHDVHKDDVEFEKDLVCSIAEFIQTRNSEHDGFMNETKKCDEKMTVVGEGFGSSEQDGEPEEVPGPSNSREVRSPGMVPKKRVRFVLPESQGPRLDGGAREELKELMDAREAGMAFIHGHSHMKAKSGSGLMKRSVINFGYELLRRNCRGPAYGINIPHASTLEVGMVYNV